MMRLQPFAAHPQLSAFSLSGTVLWQGSNLEIAFCLKGPLHQLRNLDAPGAAQRRDRLWESTCFEAFVADPQERGYWEVNLASNGDWNLYRLDGYRENLRPEARVDALPHRWQRQPEQLNLSLQLNWQGLIPADAIDLSLTAVLDHREHGCSFWAVHHAGAEPDFHQRQSFLRVENRFAEMRKQVG